MKTIRNTPNLVGALFMLCLFGCTQTGSVGSGEKNASGGSPAVAAPATAPTPPAAPPPAPPECKLLDSRYSVTLDYSRTWEEWFVLPAFGWWPPEVIEERFPIKGEGKLTAVLRLVSVESRIKTEDVRACIQKKGLGKVGFEHLLAFAALPETLSMQRMYPIVNLSAEGKKAGIKGTTLVVPAIVPEGAGRKLVLVANKDDREWGEDCFFLALEKEPPPSTPAAALPTSSAPILAAQATPPPAPELPTPVTTASTDTSEPWEQLRVVTIGRTGPPFYHVAQTVGATKEATARCNGWGWPIKKGRTFPPGMRVKICGPKK